MLDYIDHENKNVHISLLLKSKFFVLFNPFRVRSAFEAYCGFCNYFGEYIPVYFVLGFFVDTIVERWWDQFLIVPWPDEIAMSLSAYTRGHSERVRIQRRTIMRYINFSFVLATRDICSRAGLLFPNEFSLVSAGQLL